MSIKFLIFYFKSLFVFVKESLSIKSNNNRKNNDESGMASLETIPLLVVFIVLMTYGMGLWGSIHAGILNSIAARTYAFETMRNRSNLVQHRETDKERHNFKQNFRFHAINSDKAPVGDLEFIATKLPISFAGFRADESLKTKNNTQSIHKEITSPSNSSLSTGRVKEAKYRVDPIWVMIGYGYCLNLKCGRED